MATPLRHPRTRADSGRHREADEAIPAVPNGRKGGADRRIVVRPIRRAPRMPVSRRRTAVPPSRLRVRQRRGPSATDSRRFLRHGVWRTIWRGLVIFGRHRLGLPSGGPWLRRRSAVEPTAGLGLAKRRGARKPGVIRVRRLRPPALRAPWRGLQQRGSRQHRDGWQSMPRRCSQTRSALGRPARSEPSSGGRCRPTAGMP